MSNAELHRINTELNWVVQDLIAELVGMADQGLDSGWAPLYEVADHAEARLRGVSPEFPEGATVAVNRAMSDIGGESVSMNAPLSDTVGSADDLADARATATTEFCEACMGVQEVSDNPFDGGDGEDMLALAAQLKATYLDPKARVENIVWVAGYDTGLEAGKDYVVRILQDLIAGVQTAIDDYEPRMHGSARAYLLGIRDRAEARLHTARHTDTNH